MQPLSSLDGEMVEMATFLDPKLAKRKQKIKN